MYFLIKQSDITPAMVYSSTSDEETSFPTLEKYGLISNTPYYIVEVSDITYPIPPEAFWPYKRYTADALSTLLSDTETWIRTP